MQYIIKTENGEAVGNPMSLENAIDCGLLPTVDGKGLVSSHSLDGTGYALYMHQTPAFNYDLMKERVETNPQFNPFMNCFVQSYELIERQFQSEDERQAALDMELNVKKAKIRNKRNELLLKSDYTQITDVPVDKAGWSVYRQSLRDVTKQESFSTGGVQWPMPPDLNTENPDLID